jgi:acyl-CoA thioester hydrolase
MGRLHHSVYLVYFEMGRTAYMRVRGMVYAEMERRGRFIPIVSVQVRYWAAARYDDVLTIETGVREIRGARVFFTSRVVREEPGSETFIAEADVCGALVDSAGHPRRFSDDEIATLLGPPKLTADDGIPEAGGMSAVEATWRIAGNELSIGGVTKDRSPTRPG